VYFNKANKGQKPLVVINQVINLELLT